jgi:hypothetical protein
LTFPIPREKNTRFRLPGLAHRPGTFFLSIALLTEFLTCKHYFMTNSKNSSKRDPTRSHKGAQPDKNSQSSAKTGHPGNKASRNGKEDRPDMDEEPVTDPGSESDDDSYTEITDDPEQTKRKIPQMRK